MRFFGDKQIQLKLIDTIPIIRPEDCPLLSTAPKSYNSTFDVEEAFTFNSTSNSTYFQNKIKSILCFV